MKMPNSPLCEPTVVLTMTSPSPSASAVFWEAMLSWATICVDSIPFAIIRFSMAWRPGASGLKMYDVPSL